MMLFFGILPKFWERLSLAFLYCSIYWQIHHTCQVHFYRMGARDSVIWVIIQWRALVMIYDRLQGYM